MKWYTRLGATSVLTTTSLYFINQADKSVSLARTLELEQVSRELYQQSTIEGILGVGLGLAALTVGTTPLRRKYCEWVDRTLPIKNR